MKEKIIGIIQEELKEISPGIEIGMEDKLDELGLNSITFVKLMVKFEEEFDIEFDDEDLNIGKFSIIDDICKYITDKK